MDRKSELEISLETVDAVKYRIYERDYTRWVHHKYFSSQMPDRQDPIYENTTSVEGFAIHASKNASFLVFSDSKISVEAAGVDPKKKQPARS